MKINTFSILIFICMSLLSCSDKEMGVNIIPVPEDTLTQNNSLLTKNSKWSYSRIPEGLSSGTIQGAAVFNGNIYQFRYYNPSEEYQIFYDIYNIKEGTWEKGGKTIECIPYTHAGSACFAPKVISSYSFRGKKYSCTLPFVFLTGHYSIDVFDKSIQYETIDVVDIENDNLIRRYTFPNKVDDEIAAYDFEKNKVWIIGYEDELYGMSPYVIDEYDVDLNSMQPEKTNFTSRDRVSTYKLGGPNKFGIQDNLNCGTLQDVCYNNGYLYLSVGRGSDHRHTEWARIHAYDIAQHQIVNTIISTDMSEPEGIVVLGKDIYMTTRGRNLWKLTEQSGYDNKINFEPAEEVAKDSFIISNASQLVWFKSQVYNGRCNIKGTLIGDIDFSDVTDPFSTYVYDTNVKDGRGTKGRQYDSFYAFRGSFDGQGHTVKLNISKTPYYNDGLFPYVIDAKITNLKIEGKIKLTDAIHDDNEEYYIKNVGFIGYMNGGGLENIDVSDLTIDKRSVLSSCNINKLVGLEEGTITKNNIKQ